MCWQMTNMVVCAYPMEKGTPGNNLTFRCSLSMHVRVCVCVLVEGGDQPSHVHSCCCCNRVNMLNETQSELYFSTFPVLSPHSFTSCPENRLENPPQVLLCSDRDPFNHRSGYTNISAFSKITPLLPRSRMLH